MHDAEELVWCGHVMGNGLLGVSEESIWGPDLVHHKVVQPQDFSGALKLQTFINPHLTEEHVHSVLLVHKHEILIHVKTYVLRSMLPKILFKFRSATKMQSPSFISICNTKDTFQLAVEGEEK